MVFNHDVPPSRGVGGIIHGPDLGLGLVFKVQLYVFDPDLASSWFVVDI